MKIGLRHLRGNNRLRYHGALLLLLWSLIPHYFQVFHAHGGGDKAHVHHDLSRASKAANEHGHEHDAMPVSAHTLALIGEIQAARQDGFGEIVTTGMPPAHAEKAASAPVDAQDENQEPDSEPGQHHSHIGEDLNVAGLPSEGFEPIRAVLPPEYFACACLSPAQGLEVWHPARGPPNSVIA